MAYVVQTSNLGVRGFGNCLFQYVAARAYAEKIGACLQTPDWVGTRIFQIERCAPGAPVPESCVIPDSPRSVNLTDYYQAQAVMDTYTRAQARSWLKFNDEYQRVFDSTPPRPLVAHVRCGDLLMNPHRYALIKKEAYVRAAEKLNFKAADIRWISDEKDCYHPMGSDVNNLSYMQDFITLMRARILLRGNSTFSWWAAVLGEGRVFSPVVGEATGWIECPFVEGNWPKMTPHFDDLYLKES